MGTGESHNQFRLSLSGSIQYQSLPSESYPGNVICSNYFLHPSSVTLTDLPNISSTGGKYGGAYFNDKISVNRRLTVNVGLRYDRSSSFLPAQGNAGTGPFAQVFRIPYETGINNPANYAYSGQPGSYASFPIYRLWSPRVSFAYNVFGDGRVAIKGSYGRYSTLTSSPGAQLGPVSAATNGVSPLSTKSCTFTDWITP